MPAVNFSPVFNGWQGFTPSGLPLNGGFLYTYQAGTNTPLVSYTTNLGNVANANPIQLQADGRTPQEIWLDATFAYKFVLTDSLLNPLGTYDNITGIDNSVPAALTQWVATGFTPAFVNSTTFTVAGDQRATFQVNRRVRFTLGSGTVTGSVDSAAFGALTTIVMSMDSIPLDGTLSAVEVSFLTATQPAVPTYFYSPVTAGKTLTVAGAADVGGALHVSGLASHTVGVTVGNADQAGNTVLDWYLENPFTVTMAGNLTPGSVIFNQDCRYQRIGNRVFIDMYLSIVDPGGATGAITIGGLPFPLNATFAVGASNLLAYPVGSTSNGAMFMSISGTGGFFRQYPTGLSTNIATITTVASFSINGSYQI